MDHWWGLRVAFFGDSPVIENPPDLSQIIIRFSRVLQPPSGDSILGITPMDNMPGMPGGGLNIMASLPDPVRITTAWTSILTETATLAQDESITIAGEAITKIVGNGRIRIEARLQIIRGETTYVGEVQSITRDILFSAFGYNSNANTHLGDIPALTRTLLAGAFTAHLQVRYIIVSGGVVHENNTDGPWFPRATSARLIAGDPASVSAAFDGSSIAFEDAGGNVVARTGTAGRTLFTS